MIEVLWASVLIGLIISFRSRMGAFNPFQIYYSIWFITLFAYWAFRDHFIPIAADFLLAIFAAKALSLTILLIANLGNSRLNHARPNFAIEIRSSALLTAQILTWIGLPFAYWQALNLSGGADIFSVHGYINLRQAMTQEQQGFGLLAYFASVSYVVCSVRVFTAGSCSKFLVAAAISVALFFAYLGTGRTGVLLLLILSVFPLAASNKIQARGMVVVAAILIATFTLIATMTAKGISTEQSLSENISTYFESLVSYTISPFVALSAFISTLPPIEGGVHTFRFFISLANALGVTSEPPPQLIREFVDVPYSTNVYSVYEVYFRDFSYFGLFLPPLFLTLHWTLYKKSKRIGGIWIFLYSASIYPLTMQFFQDQYFSLLSTWIQITIMYLVFVKVPKRSGRTSGSKQQIAVN